MRALFLLAWLLPLGACSTPAATSAPETTPQTTNQMNPTPVPAETDTLTLGGGCFWCLEAIYQRLRGVVSVSSGYAGGQVRNPTYEQVCNGTTGHAEVIQIVYDPAQISLADLLYVFWRLHDPTTPNRQGADVGTQYRSIILYTSEAQKAAATASRDAANTAGIWPNPIVTEIAPLGEYYSGEAYHQNYYNTHRSQSYCQFVIDPKIQKLRRDFQSYLRPEAGGTGGQ